MNNNNQSDTAKNKSMISPTVILMSMTTVFIVDRTMPAQRVYYVQDSILRIDVKDWVEKDGRHS